MQDISSTEKHWTKPRVLPPAIADGTWGIEGSFGYGSLPTTSSISRSVACTVYTPQWLNTWNGYYSGRSTQLLQRRFAKMIVWQRIYHVHYFDNCSLVYLVLLILYKVLSNYNKTVFIQRPHPQDSAIKSSQRNTEHPFLCRLYLQISKALLQLIKTLEVSYQVDKQTFVWNRHHFHQDSQLHEQYMSA